MKITRLRVEQFRRFRQPFEIAGMDAGINLFAGPNEAGKSTLVAALRAAFFERYRSGAVEHLRPWDDPAASPEVDIEFELDGRHCRLNKRFLGRKRCTLQYGDRSLEGSEAEDFLAARLGFTHALRGASKAEDWGIPGLLWIEQGGAQEVGDAVTHATDHLRGALTASLGEVAGGDGDEVTAEVEKLRNELLTPASDKPRGAWLDAQQRCGRLADELARVDADLQACRQKVDRLAQLRGEQAADAAERPWETLRTQAAAARSALAEAQSMQTRVAVEREALDSLDARIDLLRRQLDALAGEQRSAEVREQALREARQVHDDALAAAAPWQREADAAQRRHDEARRVLAAVRMRDSHTAAQRERDELRARIAALQTTLAQAEAEQTRVLALQAAAAACEVRAADLAALRELAQQMRELDIRRAAVATRLRFALDDGRALHIGDEVFSGSGERLLSEATTVLLPGHGRLRIEPGGRDLAALAREGAQLADRHAARLLALGVASLDEAEARQKRHAGLQGESRAAAAALKVLAPQGVDALRVSHAALGGRLAELEKRLQAAPEHDDGTLPTLAHAESDEESAGRALTEATRRLSEARNRCAASEAALHAAHRESVAARARLDDPARRQQQDTAQAALVDAVSQRAVLAQRIDALLNELERVRPDALQQDVQRLERSAELLAHTQAQRRDDITRLEAELQAIGAQGLDERRAALARDLAAARRRQDELARRARALDLLLARLREKRQALTRRLQAPLQRHLNHYLGLLFPGAVVTLDEDLKPGPLRRDDGVPGRVDELSFGAREQMGVITRLACADLLQAAGRPTLIILDDALVHSDSERLARMKRVLFDAAQRHQILLFTCHPESWRDIGVRPRALSTA
ncbi:AAA family ATPase [Methyloversatilis thermotolerans]|uniref:AAA family ATPase n=1 Tax=Methyloversatilis thermotolerans TaxID=1346290 RepID=UPI0003651BA0|nr:AAA family ATPase [Methyloversatilis thermotolerans]